MIAKTGLHPRSMARENPDKPAIVEARTGRIRSYGALEVRANQIAHLCRSEDAQTGDCIAFLMEDRLECFDVTWAAQRAGLYYLPVYTNIDVDEAADMIDHADAVLLFTSPALEALALDIAQRCSKVRNVFTVGPAFDKTLESYPATPIDGETRGLPTQYTGGTTGKPKGLRTPLTGEPIDTPDGLTAHAVERFGFHRDMVFSTTAPLYHVAPVKLNMIAHSLGATTVLMGDFEAKWALECIQTHRITHSHWVPHMFVHMVKLPETIRRRYDVSSLQSAVHAAAPCPPAIKHQLMEWWGPIVHEIYAGTEGVGFCMIGPEEWLETPGSVGKAVIGTLKILGPDGAELPPGKVGAVYFADALPFAYYKDPERTRAAKNAQGWVTMDDLGYVDEAGNLFLRDRKGFTISISGQQVYPRVVEDTLIAHPSVWDVGITGWPSNDEAQHIIAIVKPITGVVGSDALSAALKALTNDLAPHEQPSDIAYGDTFPRDADGKLNRTALARIALGWRQGQDA